jgi:hypothetical protein
MLNAGPGSEDEDPGDDPPPQPVKKASATIGRIQIRERQSHPAFMV